jgi:hypothetical protein
MLYHSIDNGQTFKVSVEIVCAGDSRNSFGAPTPENGSFSQRLSLVNGRCYTVSQSQYSSRGGLLENRILLNAISVFLLDPLS